MIQVHQNITLVVAVVLLMIIVVVHIPLVVEVVEDKE